MGRVVDIRQNTPEWLAWRTRSIGGSDANIIAFWFGSEKDAYDYPFGSWAGAEIYKLWCIKTGRIKPRPQRDRSEGDYVDPLIHGHKTEILAREWYNEQLGEFITPVCVQHWIHPWRTASLDGWVKGQAIVEIKCPKEPDSHRRAKEGEIPRHYEAQLLHNMIVADEKLAHYVSFHGGDGVIIPVEMEPGAADALSEAEHTFWSWVEKNEFPPIRAGAIEDYNDPKFQETLDKYWDWQERSRKIEAEGRELRRRIAKILPAAKVKGCGARVNLSVRSGQQIPSFYRDESLMLRIEKI